MSNMRSLTSFLFVFSVLSGCLVTAQQRRLPISVVQSLNSETSQADFISNHIVQSQGDSQSAEEEILFAESGSFNPGGVDQIAEMLDDGDPCQPRLTTVAIEPDSDPGILHFPSCTKVHRCGGCCGDDNVACTPTSVSSKTIKVMRARYPNNQYSDQFEFEGLTDITLTVHNACQCRCRVQASQCDAQKHIYNSEQCSCQCLNREQATSCPANKVWDETECACICPRIPNCQNDEYFNFNTCSCQSGVITSSTGTDSQSSEPCDIRCRPGWEAVRMPDGTCICRVAS